MTKLQFIKRVGVEVDDYEFGAIKTVYLRSDLLFEDFCVFWMEINKSRVIIAKGSNYGKK